MSLSDVFDVLYFFNCIKKYTINTIKDNILDMKNEIFAFFIILKHQPNRIKKESKHKNNESVSIPNFDLFIINYFAKII